MSHAPYPSPTMTGPSAPRRRRLRWLPWTLIAVLAVIALVGGFLVTRSLGAVDAPASPTGLQLTRGTGQVTATWQPVAGADGYQLVRGDVVVYDGKDTKAVDQTVTAGAHTYRVQAVRRDAVSAPGESRTIDAGQGWGLYAPLIAEFPALLPQAPDAKGWDDLTCLWMLNPVRGERGPSESGVGEVWTKLRIRCADPGLTIAMHVFWFDDKDGLDGALSQFAETGTPIKWNQGTGYVVPGDGSIYVKFDDPARRLAVIAMKGVTSTMTSKELLDLANSLPR